MVNQKVMKIGIFGGSFNPIHKGHINMANIAITKLNLDLLYIVPVGIPSHKSNKDFISSNHRFNMVLLSFKKNKKIIPCDYEISSKKKSYTYDTLIKIGTQHPKSIIYEIIGDDSAKYLSQWKNYDKMISLCTFVTFKRDGYKPKNNIAITLESPLFNISSSQIREKIKNNSNLQDYITPDILNYINKNRLYKD